MDGTDGWHERLVTVGYCSTAKGRDACREKIALRASIPMQVQWLKSKMLSLYLVKIPCTSAVSSYLRAPPLTGQDVRHSDLFG